LTFASTRTPGVEPTKGPWYIQDGGQAARRGKVDDEKKRTANSRRGLRMNEQDKKEKSPHEGNRRHHRTSLLLKLKEANKARHIE